MTKERIMLAFVAIVAGLIVASTSFYFYQQKGTKTSSEQQPSPTATLPKTILDIEIPENEIIVTDKTIEVKGKSLPQSLIVLSTSGDDFVFSADENGAFSKKIALSDNENLINVTAYTDNGSETKELIITYATEEF